MVEEGLEEPTSKQSNSFKTALQTWAEIDLSSLQKQLDEQGLELKDDQKTSLLSRKNLATKTKEFKKLESDEKLQQFNTLLKLYQQEIDSLTNKKKSVENYFFGIYRKLLEAPDPRPLLEVSLDAVIELSESEELKAQIADLQDELAKKADYDNLKQRLLRNEQKAAELLSSKLLAKDEEFKSIIDEKQSNWKNQESNLKNQIKQAQKQIEELKTTNEVAELQLNSRNSQTNNSEQSSFASVLAELDIVNRDNESSKKRVYELEKRNEQLRSKLTKFENNSEINNLQETFSKQKLELESENILLVANLNQSRNKVDDLTKEKTTKQEQMNRELGQLTQEIKNLKDRLVLTLDYDEIKQELNLIKQIEFGDEEDIEENSLDSKLIHRNKALTQELADYRSKHDGLNLQVQELRENLSSINQQFVKAKQDNERLELDLQELQDSKKFNDNASIMSSMTRMTKPFSVNGRAPEEPNNSILPIITKQRDRFRDKNSELEDENKKSQAMINELKRQVNNLKQDNEELYERTRYVASFNESSTKPNGYKKLKPKQNIDLEDNPYRNNYENRMHPLEQFRMREQERIHAKLSPIDRLFITLTRAILATRTSRMLFMVYCIGLHGIIIFTTIFATSYQTTLIPEIGKNVLTGGVATGQKVVDSHI